ncbi:MAG TPA: exonuclease SbcCD subunit D [Anaerolineaceae bacterium]|nr:exonuclease SbcCD subunit D [Anaerolineaceae bacterium]
MIKILHFADAHIDMARQGQLDTKTGLPIRVMDFLKSLDTIVETAIAEKVDLVVFSGDAYRDRTPAPTYQREWGRRMMRLSRAGIPTLLLIGNHDVSPAQTRAHAMQEYDTLSPEFLHVVSKPCLLGPEELDGVQVQVVAIPWITRSGLAASLNGGEGEARDLALEIENAIDNLIREFVQKLDPDLPTILAAHASVAGAKLGQERYIMIGRDVMLQPGLLRNPAFDYVALGHIHLFQDLNEGAQPPIVYPGSIERVDFGESNDIKGFVLAEIEKGNTRYQFRRLNTRPYIECYTQVSGEERLMDKLLEALPEAGEMKDAIVRLTIDFPRELEPLIDERRLQEKAVEAFQFVLYRRPSDRPRGRIGDSHETENLTPLELLDLYWKESHFTGIDRDQLQSLADGIINASRADEG